jgi:hypothetical protein
MRMDCEHRMRRSKGKYCIFADVVFPKTENSIKQFFKNQTDKFLNKKQYGTI